MLADDTAASEVVFGAAGLIGQLPKGAIHLSMSTLSVALSERMAQAHAQAGQRYVAAPVFGRPDMAAAAKLFIVAAGDAAAIEACEPLFRAMGQRTYPMGADPSAANLVKLSGNFLMASAIEALGEAVALIGKAGIDRRLYVELLTSSIFNVPAYKTYGRLIAEGKFEPAAFAAPLGYKDIRLTLAAAENLRVPMPLGKSAARPIREPARAGRRPPRLGGDRGACIPGRGRCPGWRGTLASYAGYRRPGALACQDTAEALGNVLTLQRLA